MSDEIIERSFSVPAPASLRLANVRGTVNIHPGEEGEIAVTAVKKLGIGNGKDTLIKMKQEEDGRVIIKTDYPADRLAHIFSLHVPCAVDYDVRVPQACMLNISGVSNSTAIRGVSGDIELETVSGSLTLEEISGNLKISTVSGNVSGDRLDCKSLDLHTVSGSVDLKQSNFPAVKANTVSGGVRIESPLGQGPYNFHSVSGNLTLLVPADTRCSLKVSGISAGLKSKLPLTTEERHNGSRYAEVMGGGVLVHLDTVSGKLILDTTGDVEVRPEPELPSRPTRQQILDKIESGEMSVDEGIQALNS